MSSDQCPRFAHDHAHLYRWRGVGARAGWVWDRFGSRFTVSGDGLVATMGAERANPLDSEDEEYDEDFDGYVYQAVTCEQPMTEEVGITGRWR